ncbi:XdhC family protein [Roseiterribacter gracilis]|uniref:XdhC/CoxI family protein n=1 Tax=Roseiterribacter gracilis TaxID=2812848 RepID=A0A8S8XFC4_9PROT|nr:XdhC/CoxI family protein [Rhodospirillales bacterium TMPK1]
MAPEDPLEAALAWSEEGDGAAIATVIRTWGSSPRPVGSLLAVRGDGAFVGSVSGGCVEGATIEAARGAIEDGHTRDLKFGVADEDAWAVGLACGGEVRIHVLPLTAQRREMLRQAQEARREGLIARVNMQLADGDLTWTPTHTRSPSALADDELQFALTLAPPQRLLIVGAVHVAQALAPMAAQAGFAPTVIDARTAFADPARFPTIALDTRWPDAALADLKPDATTAIVVLTHDPKFDDPALNAALASPAFYVGALGSKRTHAKRVERLKAAGISDDDLARIRAPIGLAIGAMTPGEIAVSILAEIVRDARA